MAAVVQGLFGSDQWLQCGNSEPELSPEERAERHRTAREQAARSKSGLWGPTHSMDSEDSSLKLHQHHLHSSSGHFSSTTPTSLKTKVPNSQGTESTKSTTSSSEAKQQQETDAPKRSSRLERIWTNARDAFNGDTSLLQNWQHREWKPQLESSESQLLDYVNEVCSPCKPRALDEVLQHSDSYTMKSSTDETSKQSLGITPLEAPGSNQDDLDRTDKSQSSANRLRQSQSDQRRNIGVKGLISQRNAGQPSDNVSTSSQDTPAERRRQRHRERQLRLPPSGLSQLKEGEDYTEKAASKATAGPSENESIKSGSNLPLQSLTVKNDEARALERSISELTMRSSYAEATARLAENRRMAYYAVGRHHRNSGRGGNRRCYFTGKLILGGAPFYAGSVQQGLRTLVVFCLPSAIGLPKGEINRETSFHSKSPSVRSLLSRGDSIAHSIGVNAQPRPDVARPSLITRKRSGLSKLSSVDDMSLSIEEDLDPNWGLDRDYLLSVLPEPSQDLLDEMADRFPAQFETLPVQVRSPHCWSLYVKFCFFSGLPIAEGEMHYRVRDEISDAYGEEIILSHDVMEAVNGESAEILRLPNLKTFRYLRKHYSQQSGKLTDNVFQRQSWELVRPEI